MGEKYLLKSYTNRQLGETYLSSLGCPRKLKLSCRNEARRVSVWQRVVREDKASQDAQQNERKPQIAPTSIIERRTETGVKHADPACEASIPERTDGVYTFRESEKTGVFQKQATICQSPSANAAKSKVPPDAEQEELENVGHLAGRLKFFYENWQKITDDRV